MTDIELKAIKSIQLEMMDEIHKICVRNGITYYMIAGTLLGAVRHGGFIPWDVDVDIAMPREDYERFEVLCKAELSDQYRYLDYHQVQNYVHPHALVSHKGTRLNGKYDRVNPAVMGVGVYIDIFPLDNAPNDPELRKKQAQELVLIRKFKGKRLMYCYSFSRVRRVVHYAVATMLSWIPVQKINAYQQRIMQQYREQETVCLCSMSSRYKYDKQCMPKDVYGHPVLLDFENRRYYAPAKYTEYLTRLYGDYMRLPPEEDRQSNLEIFDSLCFFNSIM